MTLATVNERVEKRRTSPDWCGGVDGVDGDAAEVEWVVKGDVGDGTGDGYARYELSADGDRAQMAVGFRTGVGAVTNVEV